MNFINHEDLDNKNRISKFSIVNGNLILEENAKYKSSFDVGDIVTLKNNTEKIGIISFTDEDNITINWSDNTESSDNSCDLIVLPPHIGLQLLESTSILNLWENLSNGKNESFNLRCIYFDDTVINEVPFIKYFKNTNTLLDKVFNRKFNLYKKFNNNQIFRTSLYTISHGKIILDKSRYVYYLLQNNIVYYLGIDLDDKDLNLYLYNK
ncbi:MAG: hypothetical protein RSG52_07745 [Terrisporobacter sp.]|uniref:hypothetical protein n=1 Tax=Terrisporobacter sp. TaxID=1965305 RepID=UPI002FC9E871